jgi:hypothetical protein
MITRIVSLGLLCLSASMIYTADESGKKISKEEWKELREIRKAVFTKVGGNYKDTFNNIYARRSVKAVKALAGHFDKEWLERDGYETWEGIPSKMVVEIGGQKYGINAPRAEEIILAVKREVNAAKQ